MTLPYLSGNGGITGADLPPHPVTTSALTAVGFSNPVGPPKLVAEGAPPTLLLLPRGCEPQDWATVVDVGAPNIPGLDCATGAGGVYVVPALVGKEIPPLLAPPSFSCVRP